MDKHILEIGGLRNAADLLGEIRREQDRPRLVTIEDGCFCVHDPEMYESTYDIPIDDCTSRDDLLLWLRQISEKKWVTIRVIEDFSHALIRHFDVVG